MTTVTTPEDAEARLRAGETLEVTYDPYWKERWRLRDGHYEYVTVWHYARSVKYEEWTKFDGSRFFAGYGGFFASEHKFTVTSLAKYSPGGDPHALLPRVWYH